MKINLKWILPTLSVMIVGFSSCNDGQYYDVKDQTPDNQLKFNIAIDAPATRVTTAGVDYKTTFQPGDAIGVYVVAHTSGTTGVLKSIGNYLQNVKLTYNPDGTWTPMSPIYYAPQGMVLDFYAYYPYDANNINPLAINFSVKNDQSFDVDFNKSDFISAKTKTIAKGDGVSLNFKHIMSMVEVKIPRNNPSINPGYRVALTGVSMSSTLDLTSDSIPECASDTFSIPMYRATADNASTYIYRALIPTQVLSQSIFQFYQYGDTVSDGPLTADVQLTAGNATSFSRTPFVMSPNIDLIWVANNVNRNNFYMGNNFSMGYVSMGGVYMEVINYHKVILNKNYYIGKDKITNAQYAKFLNAYKFGAYQSSDVYVGDTLYFEGRTFADSPDEILFGNGVWYPTVGFEDYAVRVTWSGANAYANWVGATLPTEAQWEFAAKGGNLSKGYKYSGSNTLTDVAYDGTTKIGMSIPNELGIYDMTTHVFNYSVDYREYCSDWYDPFYGQNMLNLTGDAVNPQGPATGSTKVAKGYILNTARNTVDEDAASSSGTFRVVYNQ